MMRCHRKYELRAVTREEKLFRLELLTEAGDHTLVLRRIQIEKTTIKRRHRRRRHHWNQTRQTS